MPCDTSSCFHGGSSDSDDTDSAQNGELLLLGQMTDSRIKAEAKRTAFHRDTSDPFPKPGRSSGSVGIISRSSPGLPPLCAVSTRPRPSPVP